MTLLGIGSCPRWVLLLAVVIATPCVARAGLIGDTVSATLTDLDTSTNIFSGSAVVGAGVEFSGTISSPEQSTWTLDVQDNGFVLDGTCPAGGVGCDFFSGIRLILSGLNFSPPASLLGLASSSGSLVPDGTPVVTASSIQITFQDFSLGTGAEPTTADFQATFTTQPLSSVPEPGTIVLVLVGAAGVGLLGLRRALT